MKIRNYIFLFNVLLLYSSNTFSQQIVNCDTIGSKSNTDNLYIKKIDGDSLSSTFCIVIKKEVKAHFHKEHSETITVISGEGVMKISDTEYTIKTGDVIFVPKQTTHSVKVISNIPLKVISTQAPYFDGSDRIFIK